MWSVRILSGPNVGQIYDLKLGKNIFGRGANCDFKIQSVGISKEHCEIHVYKDKIIIVDLKSSNGTFVNGVKIQNSMLHVGDKISLFDIIMDLIPAPDIRPKNNVKAIKAPAPRAQAPVQAAPQRPAQNVVSFDQNYQQQQQQPSMMYGSNGSAAYQMQPGPQPHVEAALPAAAPQSLQEKVDEFVENTVMPAIYRLTILFPFKHVLIGFMLLFVFATTLLATIPLNIIIKESNRAEAVKRAKGVARTMAKVNEQALLSGQLGNLSVQDALKEEGIKDALIIQHSDGKTIAPSEKAGRDFSKPFILDAIKQSRSAEGQVDANTIGASHPIGVYDPTSGEPTVKYHAVVFYDVSSLNVDSDRIISLFMQILVISSVLGIAMFFILSRLFEYPIRSLNKQIDQALREKSDRTEVLFDDPAVQQLTTNVNTILNRAMNAVEGEAKPKQNRDLEFTNLVDMMVTQPAIVIAADNRIVALNEAFEKFYTASKDAFLNQSYQSLPDSPTVQSYDYLFGESQKNPYQKHVHKLDFSQFACEIFCQSILDASGNIEFYFVSYAKVEGAS